MNTSRWPSRSPLPASSVSLHSHSLSKAMSPRLRRSRGSSEASAKRSIGSTNTNAFVESQNALRTVLSQKQRTVKTKRVFYFLFCFILFYFIYLRIYFIYLFMYVCMYITITIQFIICNYLITKMAYIIA